MGQRHQVHAYDEGPPPPAIAAPLLAIFTATSAAFVANLYYAQPLVPYIAADLDVAERLAGSIVSASQFGYGIGLFLLVPLSDVVENRRLVLSCSLTVTMTLIGLATAPNITVFLFWGALTGIFSCGSQILVPYVARVVAPALRGRVLGILIGGVLTTVMLARPLSLFVTAWLGWRAVYWAAATLTAVLGFGLYRLMPAHRPETRLSYAATIRSMFSVYRDHPRVRRRTVYQALIFAAFTMFWAVAPIVLHERFHLSPAKIGLFVLVGAGGAATAPIAGRIADRGHGPRGMLAATLLIAAAYLTSIWAVEGRLLIALAGIAVVIDGAVQASQTFSRLIVLEVDAAVRGRVNALYMTLVYTTGAIGSIVGVYIYASAGWGGVGVTGAVLALLIFTAAAAELTTNMDNQERKPEWRR